MPFQPPYKRTFTKGDLIYGLATERGKLSIYFAMRLGTAQGLNAVPALEYGIRYMGSSPLTVDQYRRGNMELYGKDVRRDYGNFLRSNRAHVKYGRYFGLIQPHNLEDTDFNENVPNEVQINSAWRAKSKFGMEWTIANNRGHIHFVLNGIDMGAVVTKTHRYVDAGVVKAQDLPRGKAQDADKVRTITHSELRWIYRNRGNAQVQQRVQFWLKPPHGNWTTVAPPWEDTARMTTMPSGRQLSWKMAWSAYHPTREPNTF